jgi:hypothetical protein
MLDFAKRLMSHEKLRNNSSDTSTPDAFPVVDRLRPHLATLVGNDGFRALLARALALANAEVSWLRAVNVTADGTLEGLEASHVLEPVELLEGRVVLLAQLLGLLTAFIGPSLTLRLVGEIWPKISLAGVDFAHGDKNEKSK